SLKNKRSDDDEDEPTRLYNSSQKINSLYNYSVLLIPFYDKDKNVRDFFSKLLRSNDDEVKLSTAILMIRNDRSVEDSLLLSFAANDKYRARLMQQLESANHSEKFPAEFKTQLYITRSLL